MIKDQLKVLWFKAEDKAVEFSKLGIFETLSKIMFTIALFIICFTVFIVFCTSELILYVKDYLKSRNQKTKDVNDSDEYSAQEGYTVPDKVEPGEMDQVERIRKWM